MVKRNYENVAIFMERVKNGELNYKDGYFYNAKDEMVTGYYSGKGSYRRLESRKDGKRVTCLIHVLVYAIHFGIDELKKAETIDHISGDKYDNRIENLQPLSVLENSQKNSNGKLSLDDVATIKKDLEKGITSAVLARMFNVSGSTIYKIKSGKRFRSVAPGN